MDLKNKSSIVSILCFCLTFATLSTGLANPMMGNVQKSKNMPIAPETTFSDAVRVDHLSNGINIVLVPNHSVPMISTNIIINVGARDETWNTWGAGHFLEHMLFNGTVNRSQEEIYNELDLIGAYHNAHTGSHFTDFMLLVPKGGFEKGFEIIAEMVFASTLPTLKFEKERGIVMEEIAMSMSRRGDPNGVFRKNLYGNSPLSRNVLGTVESISRLERDSVLTFYHNWYQPNNSMIYITGDFASDTMYTWCEETLKKYRPRELPERRHIKSPDFKLLSRRGITTSLGSSVARRLLVAQDAPMINDPDFIQMLMLMQVLDRRFEKDLPAGFRGYTSLQLDPDVSVLEFSINAPERESSFEGIQLELDKILKNVVKNPPGKDEIHRLSNRYRAEEVFTSEKLHYYGIMNSPYWALVPWEDFKSWPDQMAALKPSQLAETAKKWLIRDDRYSMIIEPEMFEEENTNIATEFSIKTERLAGPGEPTVIIRTDPSARVFALHILFKDRWMWDKVYGTGAVDMLHRLILEGKDKRGRSVTTRLDEISATLKTVDNPGIPYDNYYNSPEYSFLRFETLPENWDKGIDLVFDLLKDIPIDEKNIAVPREANQNSPISIGRKKLRRTLFPSTYLSAKMHWEQDIIVKKKLTDLKISYFNPENMIISVSGPINSDDVFRNIIAEAKPLAKKSFIAQKSPEFNLKEIAAQEPISDTLTVGKAQGALLMCKIIPDISDIDQVALMIANSYFSNQLQMILREQQGLAYSLGSSLTLNRTSENVIWGLWEISISTRPENLTKANSGIQSVLKELLEHEFNSEEISRLSNSIAGRQMMRDMPRIGQAYAMGIGEFYWSDPERRQFVTDQILDMTPEEVTSAARKYLKFDSFNRMIVN